MKSKITYLLLALMLFGATTISAQQVACTLPLQNAKTNKSINTCTKSDPDKIQAIIGKATTIDKQVYEKDEAPIFTLNYDGLVIEMQSGVIKNITITNKKWKLNGLTIGSTFDQVVAKHEQIKKIYAADFNFKIKDTKGCLFIEVDELKNVKKIGVVFL
ncbi:hypothetical protein EQG63_03935 [Flavobacterium amnicola]|uniref:Beta-lactamase-inhibitor-like PepSY-like domain-containing protein n=1 Tax=Flavobacterium amnicola TaxID=2506422 RepID=A0A4Q1K6D9_9FLAO|nr:hypothetical protein [Flavobacterium amnicola]RXR21100.1 hypothetical protein EQG63_03935 [Flavobacterium amnicola]